MYRIAQEALRNAINHSGATEVIARIVTTPQNIELSVEDNGIGFEPSTIPRDHYGLVGINERARLLGGSASIDSGMGTGTRVEVLVPLTSALRVSESRL